MFMATPVNRQVEKYCENCDYPMMRAYIRRNAYPKRSWQPVGWYCGHCDNFESDIKH